MTEPALRRSACFSAPALALFAFLASTAASAAAPPHHPDLTAVLERIDHLVEASMAELQVPGTSIAVHHRGDLVVMKGYGLADVENRVPATEHTVYRIGSVTKQFTAAAMLLLEERGKLRLDDDLRRHLPDYDTKGFSITLAQLLDHTSGIKGYTEMPEFWSKSRLDLSHREMTDLFSAAPFEFEPGDRFQYNNSGYFLAGMVIERASGQSYAEFLRANLFAPLGLRESTYLDETPIVPGRAEGYQVVDGELRNDDPLSMALPYAAGSLGSSSSDLLRWLLALGGGRVVSAESLAKMSSRRHLPNGQEIGYGFGLLVGELDGRRKISHGGGINGFLSQVAWYPDDELYVVVLCNSTAAEPGNLESRIARAVLGLAEPQPHWVELTSADLERYAGTYNPGRSPFQVTVIDGGLRAQGLELRPLGEHRFAAVRDPDRVLTFEMEGGRAIAFAVAHEGQVDRGRRAEATSP